MDTAPANDVALLLQQVDTIQNSCKHEFKRATESKLAESKVSGVFLSQKFSATCSLCAKSETFQTLKTCPNCFGEMKAQGSTHPWNHEGEMVKYFGQDEPYYIVELHKCNDCGLQVVEKVFDR